MVLQYTSLFSIFLLRIGAKKRCVSLYVALVKIKNWQSMPVKKDRAATKLPPNRISTDNLYCNYDIVVPSS